MTAVAEQRDAITGAANKISKVASALTEFAGEIDRLNQSMRTIRQDARTEKMVVTPDWIHAKRPTDAVEVLAGVQAVQRITHRITEVRRRERDAHDRLQFALSEFRSFVDHALNPTPAAFAGYVRSTAAVGVRKQFETRDFLARTSMLAANGGMTDPADQLHAARSLVSNQEAAGRLAPVKNILTAGVGPRAFNVTGSGGALAAFGVGAAIASGKPADKAIASGAAGFAAGTAATGLTAIAIGTGPPGWIAIGVGAVVSMGVGYVVDQHWDDIKNFFTTSQP
ncbi:hypothetical protein [Amycolatopsis thailandensis]|uniref:hypothetical protein n=1 Tax=Amycolatopsis thailandensis TaxID=589330 RepID=UPI0036263857